MIYTEWYLLIGFAVALIFAHFFTKIIVFKTSIDKDGDKKIGIINNKSFSIYNLSRFTIIFADVDDEFSIISGFTIVFKLKLGLLLLINILIWPISLCILILETYLIVFGKRLAKSDIE